MHLNTLPPYVHIGFEHWQLYILAGVGNEFHGMIICFLLGLQLETGRRVMFVCHIVDDIAVMTHNRFMSNNQCI
jgi:hypothetical protein